MANECCVSDLGEGAAKAHFVRVSIVEDGPVRTKGVKNGKIYSLSWAVFFILSIVATPTLKCRAMARMDCPSCSMVLT